MTIYLVYGSFMFEGDTVLSIFRNRDDAENALDAAKKEDRGYDDYFIVEEELQ